MKAHVKVVDRARLEKAASLAQRVGRVIVATAGADGVPHLAIARSLTLGSDGTIAVREWFCPGTVANASARGPIALVAWDAEQDVGFQLIGSVEGMDDRAMMDGDGAEEGRPPLPQVQRALRVRVRTVLSFTQAPHSDIEE